MLEFTSWLLVFAHLLLGVIGVIFLLSGADDLFIDLNFVCRSLFRRFFVRPKHKRLSVDDLRAVSEQPIAVMIPAWDESAVVRRMLENTLRSLEYSNYHVFVGTYPNDPDTAREVNSICASFPNVGQALLVTPYAIAAARHQSPQAALGTYLEGGGGLSVRFLFRESGDLPRKSSFEVLVDCHRGALMAEPDRTSYHGCRAAGILRF